MRDQVTRSHTQTLDDAAAGSSFDFRESLYFIWRQWLFIVSVAGVFLVVTLVWLIKETPKYSASAVVMLEPRKERAPGADMIISDISLDRSSIESQMAVIKSSVFLQRVVEKQKLYLDPEIGPQGLRNISLIAWLKSIFTGSVKDEKEQDPPSMAKEPRPSDIAASVAALNGATTVTRVGQGYILSINVISVSPERAAKLANALADGFIVDQLDTRFEAAKRASAWLSDRLADLRNQLRESEEAVASFRGEHGISQSSNITLTQQQLSDLNARLVAARADAAEKSARYNLFQSTMSKDGKATNIPDAANSPLVASLRQQEATISQRMADLTARYSENHPLVVNVRSELRDVRRAMEAELQRSVENAKSEFELAKAREKSLDLTLQEVTGRTGIDNDTSIRLRELERTAAVNKTLFEDFLQKAKITQGQSTFEAREARVITPALAPRQPSFPKKGQTLAVGLLAGLLAGIAGAFAKEKLKAGFVTNQQIEEILELPLLASVSHLKSEDLTVNNKVVPISSYPNLRPLSRFSETLRGLRSGIQMTDVDNPPKVIQFTSTMPGEGKTTLGLSLATSAAQSGMKVLFIDADLRRPSATQGLGLKKETGLVELLLSHVTPQDVVRFQQDLKFWAIGAGGKTQNPSDLLGSARMKSLVDGFRNTFDYIIIDTPPMGPVMDPIIVSQLADKVVYVVRWGVTARELVRNCVKQVPGHRKIAGIVLNYVNEGHAQKYGISGYSYYYGSRYYKNYYHEG